MEENLRIDYLTISDIYQLQDATDTQIMIGGKVDKKGFSEAIRILIDRTREMKNRR